MSKFVNNLHRENSRLRDEISKLRRSLQEINSNLGSKSPVVHKKPEKDSVLSSLNKQNMIKNLKKNIEAGIFTPAKLPNHLQSKNNTKNCCKNIPIRKSDSLKENSLKVVSNEESIKKIEVKHLDSVPKSPKIDTNIDKKEENTHNFDKPKMIAEPSDSKNCKNSENLSNSEPKQKVSSNKDPKQRTLQDSFQSYYESEEENIEKFGKCELSYIKYREDHDKGSRRREKKLFEEIQNLKNENSSLKSKIKDLCSKEKNEPKRPKGATTRGRSHSRSSQNVPYLKKCSVSLISLRKKYCKMCDALLSKGFSTSFCKKHGVKK